MLCLEPAKIILGGGVLQNDGVIGQVREKTAELLNNYVPLPDLDNYICPSSGTANGALGELKLASLAVQK